MTDMLTRIEAVIRERREGDPQTSYVAKLRQKGRIKMAQKVGEEAVEAVIAAVAQDKTALVGETADMLFHLLCLLADCEISFAEVCAELERREGVSGLDEKASRTD